MVMLKSNQLSINARFINKINKNKTPAKVNWFDKNLFSLAQKHDGREIKNFGNYWISLETIPGDL